MPLYRDETGEIYCANSRDDLIMRIDREIGDAQVREDAREANEIPADEVIDANFVDAPEIEHLDHDLSMVADIMAVKYTRDGTNFSAPAKLWEQWYRATTENNFSVVLFSQNF